MFIWYELFLRNYTVWQMISFGVPGDFNEGKTKQTVYTYEILIRYLKIKIEVNTTTKVEIFKINFLSGAQKHFSELPYTSFHIYLLKRYRQTYRDCWISSNVCRTYEPVYIVAFSLPSDRVLVHVAQWLEHLTGDLRVVGPIPVWGSETFFWVCDKAWVANSYL